MYAQNAHKHFTLTMEVVQHVQQLQQLVIMDAASVYQIVQLAII